MFTPVIDEEAYTLFDFPQTTGTPERRLLLAILERAILDFVGNDGLEVTAAEEWIFGDDEGDKNAPFSFPWVCQQLDLDSRSTAQYIRQMPRRGNSRIAPWYVMKQKKATEKKIASLKNKRESFKFDKLEYSHQ